MDKIYFFKNFRILLLLSLMPLATNAQNGMAGKEFWLGFLSSYYTNVDIILNISSECNTSGTVSIPLENWDTTFSVGAGGMVTILLPPQIAQNKVSEYIRNNGVYIASEDNITVFAANHSTYSTDASYILPLNMLKNEYFGLSYTAYGQAQSDLLVVATEDNTSIDITPSVSTFLGKPAGVPYTVVLNRGQTYLLGSYAKGDISGTHIRGQDPTKPFAVFGGVYITNVPANCCADHLFQQMLPLEYWGKEYFVSPVKGNFALRILASNNNTKVKINNGNPITLNKGQYHTVYHLFNPQHISSDKEITIAQYLQSNGDGGAGDPAMTVVSPINKGIYATNFSTLKVTTIQSHYLNIVTTTNGNNKVFLDGNDISQGFTPFPSAPDYSYKIMEISHGAHKLIADSGFTANVFGIGYIDSYFYSLGIGGLNYEPIADFNYSYPACAGVPINFSVNKNAHSFYWVFGDGNSASGNNISHSYNAPGSYKILMIAESPGEYCGIPLKDTIEKTITVNDIPTFKQFTDTILCGTNSSLNLNFQGTANVFKWSTGDTARAVTIEDQGKYWVWADNNGCSNTDTFFVKKIQYPELKLAFGKNPICENESANLIALTNPGLNLNWSTGESSESITVSREGLYHIQASNECGLARDSVFIEVLNLPAVKTSNDTTILLGTLASIQGTGGDSYKWHPTNGLSCTNCPNPIASPENTTTYYYYGTSGENGCIATDSVTVYVDRDLLVYVPNIFSPNGDGQNDVLFVRGKGIRSFRFSIYNRWGEKVFESSDLNKGWNGTFRGEHLPPSVFVYVLDAILESGQRLVKKGDLTLVR